MANGNQSGGNVPAKLSEGFGVQTMEKSAELAAIAVAAAAKAEVEAAYIMAMKNPRNEDDARARIMKACSSPLFAKKARYSKPVGKVQDSRGQWVQNYVTGPSIRFAEEMIRSWRNVNTRSTTIYDDQNKRVVNITVRDLEANVSYSKEITLDKTVERRNDRDREVLGQRVNTNNQIVFVVKATEDELAIKEAANSSKVIRNNGLRLIPQHIIDEAMNEVERIIRERITKDPEAEKRELIDGFTKRGVMPSELERFIGAPIAQFSSDQLFKLREILTSIEEGVVTWAEYLEGTTAEDAKEMSEKSQPETKGKAILDKVGQPTTQPAQETAKREAPKETPKEEKSPAKDEPAKQATQEISDGQWADIVDYLDGSPERAVIKKNVRDAGKFGSLTALRSDRRVEFLKKFQEAAKIAGIQVEQLV